VVSIEAAGEGVQVSQAGGTNLSNPVIECVGVLGLRLQERGKSPDSGGQVGHLGADGGQLIQ
jgi:hypothetical protein